jgi:hypothetical protein
VLQGLLLRHQRILPLQTLQFVRSRLHLRCRSVHFLYEGLEFLIGSCQFTAGCALRQRLSLLFQLGLYLGKKLRVFRCGRPVFRSAANRVVSGRDNFLLAL